MPVDALLPDAAEGGAAPVVDGKAAPMPTWAKAVEKTAFTTKDTVLATARERAAEMLAEGAETVVALEAALALRLDPDCMPAMADPATVRTKRTAPRILDWLRRRRSA